jgi:hypothetical protein
MGREKECRERTVRFTQEASMSIKTEVGAQMTMIPILMDIALSLSIIADRLSGVKNERSLCDDKERV